MISDKLADCHSKQLLSVCFSNETKGEVELNSKVTWASVPLTPLINDKGGQRWSRNQIKTINA